MSQWMNNRGSVLGARTIDQKLRFRAWFTDPPKCVHPMRGTPMRVYSYKPHIRRGKVVGWM